MNRLQRIARVSWISGLLIVATIAWLSAGTLSPPGGPVAPAMKTLNELQPRVNANALPGGVDGTSLHAVTQPGSYYLTDNLAGAAGKYGILIDSDNVILDLNGFNVTGVAGALSGIFVSSGHSKIVIRNGSVVDWPGAGIDAGLAAGSTIERVRAIANGGDGIIVGSMTRVMGNLCHGNGGSGIKTVGNHSTLDGDFSASNAVGIQISGTGNLIVRNVATSNSVANLSIAAQNDYGQLLTSPGPGFVTTNGWTNFGG